MRPILLLSILLLSVIAAHAQNSTVMASPSGLLTYPKNFRLGHRAVIFIPLPQNISADTKITDFELKAAVSGDWENKVLYYHSTAPDKSIPQVWTKKPTVFFTCTGSAVADCRQWIKQSNTQGIYAQVPFRATVTGFIVIIEDDLSMHKDKLQWSYSLMLGYQYIKYDGATAWFPTVPVAWETDNYNPEKP